MKKSYDYFKTLKFMADCVTEAFDDSVNGKDIQGAFIKFSGIKFELSDNLIDEFVAPLERDDIFRLAFCLYEELWCVKRLFAIISILDYKNNEITGQLSEMLEKQCDAFSSFGDIKEPKKLLKMASNASLLCNRLKKELLSNLVDVLKKSSQPLLNYSIICAELELLKAISVALGELESVVINNN